jgi:hypothetical protein
MNQVMQDSSHVIGITSGLTTVSTAVNNITLIIGLVITAANAISYIYGLYKKNQKNGKA